MTVMTPHTHQWNVRKNFLFNLDSSSSGPSLPLRDVLSFPFTFFLRLLQPKAQHYVPSFPIFIIALQQHYRESGHSNMAQIEFRGLHFLPHSNLWVARFSPIFQISGGGDCYWVLTYQLEHAESVPHLGRVDTSCSKLPTALYYCYYDSHTTQLRTVGGVSPCYGRRQSRHVRPQQALYIPRDLWGKEISPLNWILNNTHRASPYLPNLSSQEGARDVQPSKYLESTHRYVYPV